MPLPRPKAWRSVACFALTTCVVLVAADQTRPTTRDAAARDAIVLQVVFDDMLSEDNTETLPPWRGDKSSPVYVSTQMPRLGPSASEVLSRTDEEKWKALTQAQMEAATEAARDLSSRFDRRDPLPEPTSTNGRLKVWEDAGAATQPTRQNRLYVRPSRVYIPGYSKEGRHAVVFLRFPWSIHSGSVTYILERTDDGWKVLLREFTYYM